MSARSGATRAVAEVLVKGGVIFLHSGCGRRVASTDCAVDHIKATLPLIQPQLKVGIATPREVLRAPFDVEDAIGRRATYRGKYAKPTVDQIQIVPIWQDRVVVSGPWQALVAKGRIGSCELGIAVG